MTESHRVEAVDFWRGVVLVAILCDHVPGNMIDKATPRNFGLSDSAEAFVFLSGFSIALAFYRRARRSDWPGVARRCLGRALRIYGVHLGLTLSAIAVFAAAYAFGAAPSLIEADGRAFVFHDPAHGVLGVAMLTLQLGYFNILPLYVVLVLFSPTILALARANIALALAVSVAIYAAARLGLALPNWPEPGTWFFNPFAWQLIFTIGMAACVLWRKATIAYSRIFYAVSLACLVLAAAAVTDAAGLAPGLRDAAFARLDVFKQTLGLGRLVHFLALAYVIAMTPGLSAASRTSLGGEFQRLGRHSLAVFAFGSQLACVGQAALAAGQTHFSTGLPIVGLLYTAFAIIGLFLFARYLEWNDSTANRRRLDSAGQIISARLPAFWRASHSLSRLLRPVRR